MLIVSSQTFPSQTLKKDFLSEVKSLEEFQARFNGTESKPGIANDENRRKNNLISLFDFQMKKGTNKELFRKQIENFTDSVILNDIKFKITDSRLYAYCLCKIQYKGKTEKITLVLQNEKIKNDYFRWAIVSVKGLSVLGIGNLNELYSISPAQHEIHFMGLQDYFNENSDKAFGYRSKNHSLDQLTIFLTLVRFGLIKFDIVENLTFYYYDIPGYIIEINEKSRKGFNSGWLITSYTNVTNEEKEVKINKMLEE